MMPIYRINTYSALDADCGSVYVGTKRAAQRVARAKRIEHAGERHLDVTITVIEVPKTKAEAIHLLNRYASHADNG